MLHYILSKYYFKPLLVCFKYTYDCNLFTYRITYFVNSRIEYNKIRYYFMSTLNFSYIYENIN